MEMIAFDEVRTDPNRLNQVLDERSRDRDGYDSLVIARFKILVLSGMSIRQGDLRPQEVVRFGYKVRRTEEKPRREPLP